MTFKDAVQFHGHSCPGLAMGFRVAETALEALDFDRSTDEELVAIVENNSCAVDAIQVVCGCTFGKGNLQFRDYGKQVYTFIKRPSGEAVRIAVKWKPRPENEQEKTMWQRYARGERTEDVLRVVHARKAKKTKDILVAGAEELFDCRRFTADQPETARIYPSLRCNQCGEKVMEPKAQTKNNEVFCIPCYEANPNP